MMSVSACSKKKPLVTEPGDGGVITTPTNPKGVDTGVIPTPGPLGVKPDDFDKNVKTIYFDFDKSNIRADQTANLEGNANYLKEHADLKICVEGHCDERGTEEYNFALGQRRASSVREFLISRGVAAERLSIVSKGEEEPAVQGHDEAAWSKNRRAMFLVTQ
jgi:peptidoglycan-associated lipoprotein